MPPTVNLSHASLVFSASEIILILKYISNDIQNNTPIKQKSEANTAKIKSVCISGK